MPDEFDIVIRNGTVVDGTGRARFAADIAVKDGKIAEIGPIHAHGAYEIDAASLIIAPGFIDMHSHADLTLFLYPEAENLIGQGVTTVFCGHCGMGMTPLDRYWRCMHEERSVLDKLMPLSTLGYMPDSFPPIDVDSLKAGMKTRYGTDMPWRSYHDYCHYLEEQGLGINLAMLIGHSNVRQNAMGFDTKRSATSEELEKMKACIIEAMEAGAYGLSLGLDYEPSCDASADELLALAECIKPYDGILAAHVHTRGPRQGVVLPQHQVIDGVKEVLEIGLQAGVRVHISHIAPAYEATDDAENVYQAARATFALIENYRKKGCIVTWDVLVPKCIPFFYSCELCKCLVYYVKMNGGKTPFHARLQSEGYQVYLAQKLESGENCVFPRWNENMIISKCVHKAWEGLSILEIGRRLGCSPAQAVTKILSIDVNTCYRHPAPVKSPPDPNEYYYALDEAALGLDNMAYNYDYEGELPDMPVERSTPTAYSGMVEYLLNRENAGVPLEKTIRQMTGNAAKTLGLTARGTLQVGNWADIVIMNLEELSTNRDPLDPRKKPSGIHYVFVNGKMALKNGTQFHTKSGAVEKYRA